MNVISKELKKTLKKALADRNKDIESFKYFIVTLVRQIKNNDLAVK
jgi:hypothetical protein